MSDASAMHDLARLGLDQIAQDLAMFTSVEIALAEPLEIERTLERPRAEAGVHLSFKLSLEREQESDQLGCVLVPLPEALALAGFLLLKTPEEVQELRKLTELDDPLRDAMLELDNLIAGALDNALRWFLPQGATLRAASCQGVREGARPHLPDSDPEQSYLLARSPVRIAESEPTTWALLLPDSFKVSEESDGAEEEAAEGEAQSSEESAPPAEDEDGERSEAAEAA